MSQIKSSISITWPTIPFPECLEPKGIVKPRKILARDYKKAGAIPVVDQGQDLIAGFTDDEDAAIRERLPFIIFGDHTRFFKFVDFPFALGADGTQLLKPKSSFNPYFFYYACLNISLPSRGYNRHFTLLKERELPHPPRWEQEKIAAVLWKAQQAIKVEEKLVATTRELKQTAMRQLFTRGLRGEDQKETDIGPVPASWQIRTLSEVAKLERGRFTHRPRNELRFYGGATPFVQTGDVVRSQGWVREYTQTLNEDGIAISRVFPKGTILITIAANIGFAGVLEFDSACPDSLVAITPTNSVDTWYLEYFLQTQQGDMDRLAPKGTQKNINIQFLSPWRVALPTIAEQREIAQILRTIDQKINVHERKRAGLRELFNTLLHKLMTGEIRIADLDIDTSEITVH